MITIVDYGMGNFGSVQNMLKRIGVASRITRDAEIIDEAKKLILPGVGAFDTAMGKISAGQLREVLDRKALIEKVPILGICLGMQLLTNRSEEGEKPGLGWIDAETYKFDFPNGSILKVPHMGWNLVHPMSENLLTHDLPPEPRFYFVHSYYVKASNQANVLATTHHGIDFHSIIQKDNIYGAQFHPEKSHRFGMKLLENFASV